MPRKFPRKIKRVVIKVGSSLIATHKLKPSMARLRSLVNQISALQRKKIEVVLVSSGAIVLGLGEFKKQTRLVDLSSLQACAAIGQTLLMQLYSNCFKLNKKKCAQVLLTWDDFNNRAHYNNARNTLKALLERKVVPIINENDTVSTDEIRNGDNDKLSAFVAHLVDADLLILLSDVGGLYEVKDGRVKFFKEIKEINDEIQAVASGTTKKVFAKGGMRSKIEAIHIASHSKIPCIITDGRTKDVLKRIMAKERIGTFFVEKSEKMLDRKFWISFVAKQKGYVYVDDGAKKALLEGGKSLLLPGVKDIDGSFKKGDVVVVCDKDGHEIGRGISNYTKETMLTIIAGGNTKGAKEVIHRDDLVLSQR